MSKMGTEIDTELAQEKLDKVLEALHSAPTTVIGLQTAIIAIVAEVDAIRRILIRGELSTEANLLNLIANNITERMEEMVDAGVLDEEALSFQTTDEDDALGEV